MDKTVHEIFFPQLFHLQKATSSFGALLCSVHTMEKAAAAVAQAVSSGFK